MFETYRSLKTSPNYISNWSRCYILFLSGVYLGAAVGAFIYAAKLLRAADSEGQNQVTVASPGILVAAIQGTAAVCFLLPAAGFAAAATRHRVLTVVFGYLSLHYTIALLATAAFILIGIPGTADDVNPQRNAASVLGSVFGRVWQKGVASGNSDVCAMQSWLNCSGLLICCNNAKYTAAINNDSTVSFPTVTPMHVPDCLWFHSPSQVDEMKAEPRNKTEETLDVLLKLGQTTNSTCSTVCGATNRNKEACGIRIHRVFPRLTAAAICGIVGLLTLTGVIAATQLRNVDPENPYTVEES